MLAQRLQALPKPMRSLRCNAAPIIAQAGDAPTTVKALRLGMEELEKRAEWLKADETLRNRLIAVFEGAKSEKTPSPHVEEQIYEGFIPNEDHQLLEAFHDLPWEERGEILMRLRDNRLKELGWRLLHQERADCLEVKARRKRDGAVAERLLDATPHSPWLTLKVALAETDQILAAGTQNSHCLQAYRRYLVERFRREQRHLKS